MMSSKLGPVQGQDSQTLGAQDATISTIQALLTRYDTQIVDKFNEETVLFDLFPTGNADPALDTLSWKIRKAGKIPAKSAICVNFNDLRITCPMVPSIIKNRDNKVTIILTRSVSKPISSAKPPHMHILKKNNAIRVRRILSAKILYPSLR